MDLTLDETHAQVLKELDRQIDLLSNGPQPSLLPPFSDDISLSNPPSIFTPLPSTEAGLHGSLTEQSTPIELEKKCATIKETNLQEKLTTMTNGRVNDSETRALDSPKEEAASFALLLSLQKRIAALEREKTESAAKIEQLETELMGARQYIFHKEASSVCAILMGEHGVMLTGRMKTVSSSHLSVAESAVSVERVSAMKDLQSHWVRDARNEVRELRERVEREKKRQKDRQRQSFSDDHPAFLVKGELREPKKEFSKDVDELSIDLATTANESNKTNKSFPEQSENDVCVGLFQRESQLSRNSIKNDAPKRSNNRVIRKKQRDWEKFAPLTVNARTDMYKVKEADLAICPTWQKVEGRPKSAYGDLKDRLKNKAPLQMRSHPIHAVERDLPFVVGQNVGKSYSVTANLQTVYSLLKSHNSALCPVCSDKSCAKNCAKVTTAKSIPDTETFKQYTKESQKTVSKKKSGSAKDSKLDPNRVLKENLLNLEKQFMALKKTYDQLVTKYDEAIKSPADAHDEGKRGLRIIGDELKSCIQSMESKRDQMLILKQILAGKTGSKEKGSVEIDFLNNSKKHHDWSVRGTASLGLLKSSLVVQNALSRVT